MKIRILLGALVLLVSGQVGAALITFEFKGIVSSVTQSSDSPVLDGSVFIDQILSGQYTFDTTTPDLTLGNPEEGNYYPSEFFTASVGNYQFTARPHIEVWNNRFGVDRYSVGSVGGGNEGVFTNGVDVFDTGNSIGEVFSWRLLLQDSDESAFSSTTLPLSPPTLTDFEIANFSIALSFGPGGGPLTIIRSSIDKLQLKVSPVPAPPVLLLFGTGLLGLIGFSKRRKAV